MRVVMTLLVRNEADIIDAHLAFHLNAGIDFVIASDTGSDDGTREVLERYRSEGRLHLIDQPELFSQIDVVTQMARLAATEFQADWVVNSDADEFWWPRSGSLEGILESVPPRFGAIRGMWRHFVARPFGDELFAERMTVRLCAPVTDRDHAFSPHFKTVHRADPEVAVGGGNHEVTGRRLVPLRGWYPIDILHFPIRSPEQCERKYLQWRVLDSRGTRPPDPRRAEAYEAYDAGRMREFYESHLVDDEALDEGLRDGRLAIDTRLRDALRSLQTGRLTLAEQPVDAGYLSEIGALEERTAMLEVQRRTAALEARVAGLETNLPSPLRRLKIR
jgi:hypothetical protein